MRKLVCVSMIVALVISLTVVLAFAQGKTTKLTKENAKVLMGTWEGSMDFAIGVNCHFVMTIDNDTPPFKGKMSMTNIPAGRADSSVRPNSDF